VVGSNSALMKAGTQDAMGYGKVCILTTAFLQVKNIYRKNVVPKEDMGMGE